LLIGEVQSLQHITHLDNISGIRRRGICCHKTAVHWRERRVIADSDVMARRDRRVGSGPLTIKDFAALYFNAHNPMLSKLRDQPGLVVLELDPTPILTDSATLLTDGNAAAAETAIGPVAEMLTRLERRRVYSTGWTHDAATRCAVQAEVLVEEAVPARLVRGAKTPTDADAAALAEMWPELQVQVIPEFFFRGSR
jgi:hypothetical protein